MSVVVLDGSGQQLADYTGSVSTEPQSSAFPRLYSDSSFINQRIDSAPQLASNSSAMASQAISSYSSSANLSNNNAWGIPIVDADAQSSAYPVGCSDYWCNVSFSPVHIPSYAQPNSGSDSHLVVLQPDGSEMDMWATQHTSSGWSAGTRWLTSDTGSAANCTTAHACGGADVANFALAAGVIRPEEIAQGHIDHALAITTPDTRQGYVACPATNGDGTHTDTNALPIGAHIQLDPNINVNNLNLPRWQKTIAIALQQYGAYVVDTSGSLEVRAEANIGRSYDAWAKAGVPANSPSIANLPWGSTRVLSMTHC